MKKIIFLSLLFFLIPGSVYAIDYDITKFQIEATVDQNGDMIVNECFIQDGSFNGYIRDIIYHDSSNYSASGILDVKVYTANTNCEKSQEMILTTSGSNGLIGYYEQNNYTNSINLKMYNYANNEAKGYYITYKLRDVAILHNDVGEIYWNFIGRDFADTLNNVSIKITLPNNDDTIRVWAHGPLNGEVYPISNGLLATISYVDSYTAIDARMTFNKSQIPYADKITNTDALTNILAEEKVAADDANQKREEIGANQKRSLIYNISYVILSIFIIIYTFIMNKKNLYTFKKPLSNEYYREFPNNDTPSTVEYLITHKISTKSLAAEIMDLIRRKMITVTSLENKEYLLTNNSNNEQLSQTDTILMHLLFDNTDDEKSITTKTLRDYPNKNITARELKNKYALWNQAVINEAQDRSYFTETTKYAGFLRMFPYIFCIFFSFCSVGNDTPLGMVLFFISLICARTFRNPKSVVSYKLTSEGNKYYPLWLGLKKFMLDFGKMDDKELPEVALWEKYLVYATMFGIADKVQKVLKLKVENNESAYNDIQVDFNNILINDISEVINNSIHHAYKNAIPKEPKSSWKSGSFFSRDFGSSSSSSGGGGGFSSRDGGSSGGGGGGGGRGF